MTANKSPLEKSHLDSLKLVKKEDSSMGEGFYYIIYAWHWGRNYREKEQENSIVYSLKVLQFIIRK